MTDTMLTRAVANALWPYLRHNHWQHHRETRDLASHGTHPNYRSIGTAKIHNHARTYDEDIITDERYIRATTWADEWPGALNLVIELHHHRYLAATLTLPPDTHTALIAAYHTATCRAPFERTTNRHGTPTLRRNSNDPHLTPAAAHALETIATYADTRTVNQHDLDDALLTDEDINLEEVKRATGVRTNTCATV